MVSLFQTIFPPDTGTKLASNINGSLFVGRKQTSAILQPVPTDLLAGGEGIDACLWARNAQHTSGWGWKAKIGVSHS